MTPDDHTIQEFFLEVGNGHQLYIHEWGNKKAKTPVLFLHGGPGSGCKDKHRSSFDPEKHRVIFFDQRGAGRSLPFGSLEHNTTDDLIKDIEKIAIHFKAKQFILVGGSWGSALALAYALKHPKRVKAMVLTGIFTGSKAEINWIDKGEFRTFYPDVWQHYLDSTPKKYHADPSAYHYKQAREGSDAAKHKSALAYGDMEGGILSLDDRFTPTDPVEFDPTSTLLEMHYLSQACFMSDHHILNHAHKLTMPVWLVQGRYDMVCPPRAAYELNQKLPNSHLIWTIGGHRSAEHETSSVIKTILLNIS